MAATNMRETLKNGFEGFRKEFRKGFKELGAILGAFIGGVIIAAIGLLIVAFGISVGGIGGVIIPLIGGLPALVGALVIIFI